MGVMSLPRMSRNLAMLPTKQGNRSNEMGGEDGLEMLLFKCPWGMQAEMASAWHTGHHM